MASQNWYYQVLAYRNIKGPTVNVGILATSQESGTEQSELWFEQGNKELATSYGVETARNLTRFLNTMAEQIGSDLFLAWWQTEVPLRLHRRLIISKPRNMLLPVDGWRDLLISQHLRSQSSHDLQWRNQYVS